MAEFRMPSLGADMEAGTLVEWMVHPGSKVKRGDVVAVVETDKGAIDVEIWESGVVDELKVAAGTSVPVGTVLATLRQDGAAAPAPPAPVVAPPAPVAAPPAPVAAPPAPVAAPPAPVVPPPLAVASEPPLAPIAVALAPPAPAPVAAPPAASHVRASPSARQLARERGIALAALHGTGPSGAITRADVERASAPAPAPTIAMAPPPAPSPAAPPPPAKSPTIAMRHAIAAAMTRAHREIPQYYVATHIDVTPLQTWLTRENARRPVEERLLPIVPLVKAIARGLTAFPELNGWYVDDAFRPAPAVHLGFAVALRGGGLIAPALHDCEKKTLAELQAAIADLIRRTRAGALRSSELTDATITLTSLGDRGVETVYGIIYPPQVALVGLGTICERPWAVDGLLGVRSILHATLAADHRVSDGHRGALFLESLAKLLAEPEDL